MKKTLVLLGILTAMSIGTQSFAACGCGNQSSAYPNFYAMQGHYTGAACGCGSGCGCNSCARPAAPCCPTVAPCCPVAAPCCPAVKPCCPQPVPCCPAAPITPCNDDCCE